MQEGKVEEIYPDEDTKTKAISQKTTYKFLANLSKSDNVDNNMTWEFQVLAKNEFDAEKILREYLSDPGQTGLKYIECIGLKQIGTDRVIMLEK